MGATLRDGLSPNNQSKRVSQLCLIVWHAYYSTSIYPTFGSLSRKNGLKVVVISDLLSNLTVEHLNKLSSPDTYLILIPFGLLNQKTNFSYLKEVNAFDIFVLTPDTVYILKENKEKEVTDTINKSLIIRASGINHLGINS